MTHAKVLSDTAIEAQGTKKVVGRTKRLHMLVVAGLAVIITVLAIPPAPALAGSTGGAYPASVICNMSSHTVTSTLVAMPAPGFVTQNVAAKLAFHNLNTDAWLYGDWQGFQTKQYSTGVFGTRDVTYGVTGGVPMGNYVIWARYAWQGTDKLWSYGEWLRTLTYQQYAMILGFTTCLTDPQLPLVQVLI